MIRYLMHCLFNLHQFTDIILINLCIWHQNASKLHRQKLGLYLYVYRPSGWRSSYVYIYIYIYNMNCVMTGQLWARKGTEENRYELFQTTWRLLYKYTEENHANLQQTWTYFRSRFALGPSLTQPKFFFFNYLQYDGSAG